MIRLRLQSGRRRGGLPTLSIAMLSLLAACTSVEKGTVGDRCSADSPCKKGLHCSLKKKRCYRPVNCRKLAKRLKTCTADLVGIWQPAFKKLPSAKRVALLERVREHLKTQVVDHCRYDARTYRKKHGKTPPSKRSYGEDRGGRVVNGCLAKASCAEFATCWLKHARLTGKRAPKPGRMPVFPLAAPRPRPVPTPSDDAGVPTGKDAMEPGKDAMKPGKDTMKPGKDAMKREKVAPRPAERRAPRPTNGPAPRPMPR